jgi:ATP-dependent Clp protease ATP-binding subunit ClpC
VEKIRSEISLPTTRRAQKVLTLAEELARKSKAPHVLSEHLLLGLLAEGGGVAAKVLKNLGIEARTVRFQLASGSASGRNHDDPLALCLERAEGAALRMGHAEIGTEHLLLGIAKARDCRACVFLRNLNVNPQSVAKAMTKIMADYYNS